MDYDIAIDIPCTIKTEDKYLRIIGIRNSGVQQDQTQQLLIKFLTAEEYNKAMNLVG